ncbi:NADH dehydrogenase [Mycobacterium intracellulare subsp. chimaera]|nr:NADH dehydrogenase [Mycobacterium intracellulare subsp. chimaera]
MPPAQNPGQTAGAGESGEAASHDHDGGHRPECRRTSVVRSAPRRPETDDGLKTTVRQGNPRGPAGQKRPRASSARMPPPTLSSGRFVIVPCASLYGS